MSTNLVIVDDGTDEASWLAARNGFYTATRVTAIARSSPYSKPIDVWNEITDPDFTGDHLRNKWLEERAEVGHDREPHIIEQLSQVRGAAFTPNQALLGTQSAVDESRASTPDGILEIDGELELAECKATQQRWDEIGIPQHILDQCFWQMFTTGAKKVWLGVEFIKWSRAAGVKRAKVVGFTYWEIEQNPERLRFMLDRVADFDESIKLGIAPESDIVLSDVEAPAFGDSPEETAEKALARGEADRVEQLMNELASINDALKPLEERADAIKAQVKEIAKNYEGNRIWFIGSQMVAKFSRSYSAKLDTKKLTLAESSRITVGWPESSRLTIEPNPEYVPPETGKGL